MPPPDGLVDNGDGKPSVNDTGTGGPPKVVPSLANGWSHHWRNSHPSGPIPLAGDKLAAEDLRWPKKSWNGLLRRHRLLIDAGIELPDVIADAASAAADDLVDAAVVAWSARRIATGTARTFPDPPQESGGRRVAIWC